MLFQNEHSRLASEALGHFTADFFAMTAALCIAHDSWHQLLTFIQNSKRLKCSSLFAISRAFGLIKLNVPLGFFLGLALDFMLFWKGSDSATLTVHCCQQPAEGVFAFTDSSVYVLSACALCCMNVAGIWCETNTMWHESSVSLGVTAEWKKGCFFFSELKYIYLTRLSKKVIQRQNDFLAQRQAEF